MHHLFIKMSLQFKSVFAYLTSISDQARLEYCQIKQKDGRHLHKIRPTNEIYPSRTQKTLLNIKPSMKHQTYMEMA